MTLIESVLSSDIWIVIAGILLSFVAAKVLHFVISKYVTALTKKTKTDLDDRLLEAIESPFVAGVVIIGSYFSILRLEYIKNNLALVHKAYFVIAVFWAAFVAQRVIKILVYKWLESTSRLANTPKLAVKGIYAVIYFIATIVILNYFNVEITPLIATLGIGGIAIGLALQDTLSNFFAGLYIISDKPVNIGDFIELENNTSGYVTDIGWRTTRIKTLRETMVIIPNSKIASSIITNNNLPVPEMSIAIPCGISYHSDLKEAEKVTVEVAKRIQNTVPGAVKGFEPFIRYNQFGDSNINFSVIMKVENFVDKYLITHELIKELKEAYDKKGIEISWPVRKVYYGEKEKAGHSGKKA